MYFVRYKLTHLFLCMRNMGKTDNTVNISSTVSLRETPYFIRSELYCHNVLTILRVCKNNKRRVDLQQTECCDLSR